MKYLCILSLDNYFILLLFLFYSILFYSILFYSILFYLFRVVIKLFLVPASAPRLYVLSCLWDGAYKKLAGGKSSPLRGGSGFPLSLS